MLKKIILIFLSIGMVFALGSCKKAEPDTQETTAAITENAKAPVDIDMSQMNFNLIYAQVNEMKNSPSDYLGKRVKVTGTFKISHYDATDKDYYYVIGADTTACCNWSIEFLLKNGESYPEDGKTVTVEGIYSTYDEQDITYYYIDVDSMKTV